MASIVNDAIDTAPCVIFFDELDSYGKRGGASKHRSNMVSVINDLLQQLTRLNAAEGVIVLAATNYPENIDPAIRRSGRFDLKIPIGHPDKTGVRDILSKYVGKDIHITNNMINQLLGRSGADLANVARDAKSRARRQRSPLTTHHLAQAIGVAVDARSPDDLYRIAVHEAGHVTIAACLGLSVPQSARVTPAGGEVLRFAPRTYTRANTPLELAYHLGGRAAEKVVMDDISSGSGGSAASDLDLATELAIEQEQHWGLGRSNLIYAPVAKSKRFRLSDAKQRIINERLQAAEALAVKTLTDNRQLLETVANALLKHRELDSGQIHQLCEAGKQTEASLPAETP
jgi:cell division protease FtsH